MMHIKSTSILLTALFLAACNLSPYSVSINNNVLFNPREQQTEETFADPALQACVNNYLDENPEESLATMTILSCTNSAISSLAGLDRTPALTLLDLSNNAISDLGPLGNLKNLRVFRASNNQIRNINVLYNLAALNFIDLSGNNELQCSQLDRLEGRLRSSLRRPLSCY